MDSGCGELRNGHLVPNAEFSDREFRSAAVTAVENDELLESIAVKHAAVRAKCSAQITRRECILMMVTSVNVHFNITPRLHTIIVKQEDGSNETKVLQVDLYPLLRVVRLTDRLVACSEIFVGYFGDLKSPIGCLCADVVD